MKTTDKVVLAGLAIAILAGFGLHYLLPEASIWFKVVAAIFIGGAAYGGITQQIATERLANRDVIDKP